jgi:hypothetical protein
MGHRLLVLLCLPGLCAGGISQKRANGDERAVSPVRPLQVELLQSLDAGKAASGGTVLAKAMVDWHDAGCHVRAGGTVTGHILDIVPKSKQSKGSTITVGFDHADCDGHVSAIAMQIYAIVAAPPRDEGVALADTGGLFGQFSPKPPMTMGGKPAPSPPPADLANDVSVRNHSAQGPKQIQAGDVMGLKQVTLSVGTGKDGASVLSAQKGNIRLEQETQLVLMPPVAKVVKETQPASAVAKAPAEAVAAVKPAPAKAVVAEPKEIDETEICTEGCSVVGKGVGVANASRSLSIAELGSLPHDHGSYVGFGYESTITYVDAGNLLFTYDPHRLRHRTAAGLHTESMRTVRAVLLDAKTLGVKKVVEWEVQGDGQYIWPAGPGAILVHVGHRLRLMTASLGVIREMAVPGELAFVSVSPSAYYIAVGTLHERYTKEAYEQLKSGVAIEPEEDVDVRLVDGEFTPLLTTRQGSRLPAPVLTDTGELRVNLTGTNRWVISERMWNKTSRKIATTTSACRPALDTPLPSLVFLMGCSEAPQQNWYRMLREDGRPILNGRGSSQEIEEAASSSNDEVFAVRVVDTVKSQARGDTFAKGDLEKEDISVYRSSDGKHLFSTETRNVAVAEQSFALSPAGDELAVLSERAILLFHIGGVGLP